MPLGGTVALIARSTSLDAVGDEVDGDDEGRDREGGEERRPPVRVDERPVLVDLRRPVRRRRLDAEADEASSVATAKIA